MGLGRVLGHDEGLGDLGEPKTIEHKFYVKGIGLVGERLVVGGSVKVDLVEVRKPGA